MPRNPMSASEGYDGGAPRDSSKYVQPSCPARNDAQPAPIQVQVCRWGTAVMRRAALKQQNAANAAAQIQLTSVIRRTVRRSCEGKMESNAIAANEIAAMATSSRAERLSAIIRGLRA